MQPHDLSTPTGSKLPSKNTMTRSVLTLVLLVFIVGGIAWVIQYLPSRGPKTPPPPPEPLGKKLLAFRSSVALWRKMPETAKKVDMEDPVKDVEHGTRGHYDFLFKNVSGEEVDLLFYVSTCDCTSVKACLLPPEEWERVNKVQGEYPGEPLPYAKEPSWLGLTRRLADEPVNKAGLTVKPDEAGVVRVEWIANKAELTVIPAIILRPKGDSRSYRMDLGVPVRMKPAIQFDPPRVNVGVLMADKTIQTAFDVWSSTRDKLDFTLTSADPLFVFEAQQLAKDEFAAKTKELSEKKLASRVLCAYRISVTVHESKDDKHLDQGSFYRKFPFALDGKIDTNATLWGPEIVGRVDGDIQIGGADDQRRILFKSFDVKTGASKEVQLATDANVKLKTYDGHKDQPPWIEVNLTRDEKQASPSRVTWLLKVTVKRDELRARSFEEPDAVVLQIEGTTDRFLRIPLEGHISR